MSFLVGAPALRAALVHHTGSMIRFQPSQLPHLPPTDVDCAVTLVDGKEVLGRFHRHPANPYIGGAELVRWIKTWVRWNEPVIVFVEQIGKGMSIRLRTRIGGQSPTPGAKAVRRKAVRLSRIRVAASRRRSYNSWERDPALRQLVLQAWNPQCQVVGCQAGAGLPPPIAERILDVHHIEFVSSGGSDSPTNLCLLCASHHALVHRVPSMRVAANSATEVQIEVNGAQLVIRRNVAALWSLIDV